MKEKKSLMTFIKIISLMLGLIIAYLLGCFFWKISPKAYEPSLLSYDYYKSERYLNPDPFLLFSKYYYNENISTSENNDYKLVKENKEKIKNYISTSLNKLYELDNTINIEFNYENITSNDSYLLKYIKKENLVILHYYDEEENILYTIYVPNEFVNSIE